MLKKIIFITGIFTFVISCRSTYLISPDLKKIPHPKIDSKFEHISIPDFIESRKHSGKTFNYANETSFEEFDTINRLKLQLIWRNSEADIFLRDYSGDIIFGIFKQYYPDGDIKEKGLYCRFGFKIGTWSSFGKNHELLSRMNYDKGFHFDTRALFRYCKTKSIPLTIGDYQTQIAKTEVFGNKAWAIKYRSNMNASYITEILSGSDGHLIQTYSSALPLEH